MNKSFFALVFALPLLTACFWKKAANVEETIKTEVMHEEMVPATPSNDQALNDQFQVDFDDASDENDENDEK